MNTLQPTKRFFKVKEWYIFKECELVAPMHLMNILQETLFYMEMKDIG